MDVDSVPTLNDLGIAGLPVRKVSDNDYNFTGLIYGRPGVGKTLLAASAYAVPELHPMLWLDTEKGSNSFRLDYPDMNIIPLYGPGAWDKTKKVITRLTQGNTNVKTVVVDNISETAFQNMKHIMGVRKGGDPMATPEFKEFNLGTSHMLELVRTLRDLPNINVLFTAWHRVDTDDQTKMMRIRPHLSPSLADVVPGLVDEVFYYYMKEEDVNGVKTDVRTLLTSSVPSAIAKDRSGKLPKRMRNPDMKTIYYTITGKVAA